MRGGALRPCPATVPCDSMPCDSMPCGAMPCDSNARTHQGNRSHYCPSLSGAVNALCAGPPVCVAGSSTRRPKTSRPRCKNTYRIAPTPVVPHPCAHTAVHTAMLAGLAPGPWPPALHCTAGVSRHRWVLSHFADRRVRLRVRGGAEQPNRPPPRRWLHLLPQVHSSAHSCVLRPGGWQPLAGLH